jgi:hypothetical protein
VREEFSQKIQNLERQIQIAGMNIEATTFVSCFMNFYIMES